MKSEKKMFIAFILNLFFSIVELLGGIFTGSIAIISDALHDFGDATSIGLSFLFEKKSKKQPNERYTYGYGRFSVLGGLISIVLLLVGSCVVVYNAVLRIINPVPIDYNGMIILAVIGLIVNAFATFFTHGGASLNQKALNLHMLEDLLGWAIVLIGAIVMRFTSFHLLDPILSIASALFIIFHACKHLKSILAVFLLKTPKKIDVEHLKTHLLEIDGVRDVHHIHLWSIDGDNLYATMHVVADEYSNEVKNLVKDHLTHHGIDHATIEMETTAETCEEIKCTVKSHELHCHHHHH